MKCFVESHTFLNDFWKRELLFSRKYVKISQMQIMVFFENKRFVKEPFFSGESLV